MRTRCTTTPSTTRWCARVNPSRKKSGVVIGSHADGHQSGTGTSDIQRYGSEGSTLSVATFLASHRIFGGGGDNSRNGRDRRAERQVGWYLCVKKGALQIIRLLTAFTHKYFALDMDATCIIDRWDRVQQGGSPLARVRKPEKGERKVVCGFGGGTPRRFRTGWHVGTACTVRRHAKLTSHQSKRSTQIDQPPSSSSPLSSPLRATHGRPPRICSAMTQDWRGRRAGRTGVS